MGGGGSAALVMCMVVRLCLWMDSCVGMCFLMDSWEQITPDYSGLLFDYS